MNNVVRGAVAEAFGTFLFVFSIISAVNNAGDFAGLAIGFTLMVLVFATGHISGAHFNPAVSFGLLIRGAINVTTFVAYVVAQIVGGVIAALVTGALYPAGTPKEINVGAAFLVEAVFTAILVWVVLNVATSKDTDGNSFYGLAIGSTVVVGAYAVGPISGGGFNPAVAISLGVSGQFGWGNMWLYIVAPLVGAAVSALVFRVLSSADVKK